MDGHTDRTRDRASEYVCFFLPYPQVTFMSVGREVWRHEYDDICSREMPLNGYVGHDMKYSLIAV